MSLQSSLNKRIRARVEDDDSEAFSDSPAASDTSDLEGSEVEGSDSEAEDDDEDDELSESSSSNPQDVTSSINQISFGALAKAQDSLGKKRKRGSDPDGHAAEEAAPSKSPLEDIRARIRAAREEKAQSTSTGPRPDRKKKEPLPHRSSKNAPTVQSSKRAVTRRRTVVDTDAAVAKPRDPRFDSAVNQNSQIPYTQALTAANKNYSFLTDYRASELSALKSQLAKTKNPDEKAELKKQITSLADKARAHDRKMKEREILAAHKKKERQLIKEGKKSAPWFMKQGEVKKEILKERYEGMGAREKKKSLERRRKKVASKERREMPDMRRGVS